MKAKYTANWDVQIAGMIFQTRSNALSDKKHKIHYWMYTVFDDAIWIECQQKKIMVLGMDDIAKNFL